MYRRGENIEILSKQLTDFIQNPVPRKNPGTVYFAGICQNIHWHSSCIQRFCALKQIFRFWREHDFVHHIFHTVKTDRASFCFCRNCILMKLLFSNTPQFHHTICNNSRGNTLFALHDLNPVDRSQLSARGKRFIFQILPVLFRIA